MHFLEHSLDASVHAVDPAPIKLGLLGARTHTGLQREGGGRHGSRSFRPYAQEGVGTWAGSAVYLGLDSGWNGRSLPWGLPASGWPNHHGAP